MSDPDKINAIINETDNLGPLLKALLAHHGVLPNISKSKAITQAFIKAGLATTLTAAAFYTAYEMPYVAVRVGAGLTGGLLAWRTGRAYIGLVKSFL